MKPKVAIIRGTFLNNYEMQFFEPLVEQFDITAFGSLHPYHENFAFPVIKLWSPMDLPNFPKKMSVLNRIWTDAHYLHGLEDKLSGFDLVHTAESYFYYTHQSLEAKKRGKVKKVIATILENIPFNNEGIRGRKALKQQARQELDHLIALTERTKIAMLLEGTDAAKVSVISHFVDTKRFTSGNKLTTNNQLTILFCGRLETYKGVYELLYSAALLINDPELKEYRLQFLFVGNGSEKLAMIAREQQLGISSYVTHKDVAYTDMPGIYQQADIYTAPSKETDTWIEQYNTSLLEAQSAGLPIVTTNSGGIPENVDDAAIFINPGDVLSLYEALKKFILSPKLRETYAQKARQRAEKVHDIRIGAGKIADVWNMTLSR